MAMNFVRTFVSSGRAWDSKVIQLPHLADLFKRNYFAPGALRMPDSPLVRKYLEMSNDSHMLESITGEDAATREARSNALASAVSAGALGPGVGEGLRPGAPPVERAAVAMAAVDRVAVGDGGMGGMAGGGATSSQAVAQMYYASRAHTQPKRAQRLQPPVPPLTASWHRVLLPTDRLLAPCMLLPTDRHLAPCAPPH